MSRDNDSLSPSHSTFTPLPLMFSVLNPKKKNIFTHTSFLLGRRKLLASLLNGAIKQQHFKLYLTATGELLLCRLTDFVLCLHH